MKNLGNLQNSRENKKLSRCEPARKDKPVNLKERAVFLILILSASSMDSDNQIIPGLLTIITLLILYGQAV